MTINGRDLDREEVNERERERERGRGRELVKVHNDMYL